MIFPDSYDFMVLLSTLIFSATFQIQNKTKKNKTLGLSKMVYFFSFCTSSIWDLVSLS